MATYFIYAIFNIYTNPLKMDRKKKEERDLSVLVAFKKKHGLGQINVS